MLRLAQVLIAGLGSGLIAVGGWAVVTVKDLPEYYVAGQAYTLDFQVRQHGRTLLTGLQPSVVLSTERGDSTIAAVERGDGVYRVTFTAPAATRLALTINSGFMASVVRLSPAPIVAAASARAPLAAAERGQQLFVAKGCVTCHVTIAVGPKLAGRHLPREYVFQKIKDPRSQIMPNLGLSDAEAGAIADFVGGR
jgi:mono/diheme cytochrome c family protein